MTKFNSVRLNVKRNTSISFDLQERMVSLYLHLRSQVLAQRTRRHYLSQWLISTLACTACSSRQSLLTLPLLISICLAHCENGWSRPNRSGFSQTSLCVDHDSIHEDRKLNLVFTTLNVGKDTFSKARLTLLAQWLWGVSWRTRSRWARKRDRETRRISRSWQRDSNHWWMWPNRCSMHCFQKRKQALCEWRSSSRDCLSLTTLNRWLPTTAGVREAPASPSDTTIALYRS